MSKYLNIVSFDVPFPADYGGVIDVFHKIRTLNSCGIKIILHCFQYGRNESLELNNLCEKVYYYKRFNSISNNFHIFPFIVKSRISQDLIKNLDSNDYPIIFEGLHTCGNALYLKNKNRKLIYRESNIEHNYYKYLAKNEKSVLKKTYFYIESIKLFLFQKKLQKFDLFAVVSREDELYLKNKFPKKEIEFIPSFHEFDSIQSKLGIGNYILFHGNLSVSENYKSLYFLIDNVFSKINQKVIIAGKNPSKKLIEKCNSYLNITLIANPEYKQMKELIINSQIICLHTFQKSGLKLKLLYSLFAGRFVLVNSDMLYGTSLSQACIICNSPNKYIYKIDELFKQEFNKEILVERTKLISNYNNISNSNYLINKIYNEVN